MDPNAAQWLAAGAAAGTLLTAIAATAIGVTQVRQARALRRQTAELQRNSQLQALELDRRRVQPSVVVSMEDSEAGQNMKDIVIRNYGQTPARDVRAVFDPAPQRVSEIGDDSFVGIPSSIPFLAPGQEFRTLWDAGRQYLPSTLPKRVDVHVSFLGINDEELHSSAVLDWDIFRSVHYVRVYNLHDAAKALSEMEKRTKSWTESKAGLKIVTRSGAARDEAARRHHRQWLRARGEIPAERVQPPPKRRG